MGTILMNKFYVYLYPGSDNIPSYVGKGKVLSDETKQKMSKAAKCRGKTKKGDQNETD